MLQGNRNDVCEQTVKNQSLIYSNRTIDEGFFNLIMFGSFLSGSLFFN